jgi:hypothetical protein
VTGLFAEELFLYLTKTGKVHCLVKGRSLELGSLPKGLTLLGYVEQHERIWLMDNSYRFLHFTLRKSLIQAILLFEREEKVDFSGVGEADRDTIASMLIMFERKR